MDPNENVRVETVSKIFACLSIAETILSIIFNPLVLIIILNSKKLRQISTFKILAVSAVNDMLVTISWNVDMFGMTMFNYIPSSNSIFFCRFFATFLGYATLFIETWILLSISADRLLSMTIKKWAKFYFKGYRPYIYAVLLCVFIAGLNIFVGVTSGNIIYDDQTQTSFFNCYMTDQSFGYDWYNFEAKLVLYFGYIVPTAILIIVNVLIIYKATQFSRSQKAMGNTNSVNAESERKKTQMTKMILFLTFFYTALQLSMQIYSGYIFFLVDQASPYYAMLNNVIIFVQSFYPTFHFFILFFSNNQFAKEVKQIFLSIKSNRVSTNSRSQNNLISNHASNLQIKDLYTPNLTK